MVSRRPVLESISDSVGALLHPQDRPCLSADHPGTTRIFRALTGGEGAKTYGYLRMVSDGSSFRMAW